MEKHEVLQVFALYNKAPIDIFDDKELPLRGVPAIIEGIDFRENVVRTEHVKRDDLEKIKLILRQVCYMPDSDIYNYCYAYDNIPFAGTVIKDWIIDRESDVYKIRNKNKLHAYEIDIATGEIKMLRSGLPSSLGRQAYAVQWLVNNNYAIPLYFEAGHPDNGKTPFDLKLAIPNRRPLYDLLVKIYNNDSALIKDWYNDKLFHNIDLGDIKIFNSYVDELKKQLSL